MHSILCDLPPTGHGTPPALVTRGGGAVRKVIAGPFRVSSAVFPPHLTLPSHYHEDACVSVILDGRFVQEFPTRTCECPAETVLAKPSGERHVDRWFAAPTRHLIIEFDAAAAQTLGACGSVVERISHGRHPAVASLARRMVAEMERPDDVTATILEGLALETLSRLHRGNRRNAGPGAMPRWLSTIREYLHDRFRGPIRLDVLALEVGIHADHVSRVFADRFGCSVGEYVRALRVDAALCELVTTETPLAEVAHRCGFSDQSHLTRLVKRETGQTPGQYRAAHGHECQPGQARIAPGKVVQRQVQP